MAVRYDAYDQSLVVDGFEKGISDDPFTGIADEKNVNIISIPNEASVNFATQVRTITISTTFSIDSSNAGADTIHVVSSTGLEYGLAITFATTPSITASPTLTVNTPYWLNPLGGNNFQLYSSYASGLSSVVDIQSNGTGVFSVINPSKPKYFAVDGAAYYWMIDSSGLVWSTQVFTGTNNYWTYTGNKPPTGSTNGNGLGYYEASDGTGYIFAFHNSSIDVTKSASGTFGWNYQWNPSLGNYGGFSLNPTRMLNSGFLNFSHETLVGRDNVFYYCDSSYLGSFFEKRNGPPNTIVFDPTSTATYTWNKQALALPETDNAQCLAELGINLLIGGQWNFIYPWNRTATSFTYPIFLAESNIQKMTTINTNTYIFVGNRGRIYVTNGTNAGLYKKIPDHISGTVEPYFTWGGVGSTKNQLYFSALVLTNSSGTELPYYGGVWAIDMDTKAIRLVNKLSYGTYAGYATAFIPIIPNQVYNPTNPAGTGFYAGWQSANSNATYGIDGTTSSPYTTSVAQIDSDLIPIGTYDKPRDMTRVEYRLTKPMVSGESVTLNYRLDFSQAWLPILTDSTVGNFSLSKEVNFKNAQWLQLQAILNSTASSPSYTRLREFRIRGIVPQNG